MNYSSTMDLNTLRLFVAVVQAGSFSKTSEQIGMPLPTLSRRIGELEQQLDMQLFDRTRWGVKPTVMGQQLYEQVQLPLDSLSQVKYSLDNEALSGKLRLSMIAGIEPVWSWISEFQQLYPLVDVHCQATDRIVDLIEDGIDVAFRMGALHAENVIAFPVLLSGAKLVATPDFIQKYGALTTVEALKDYPMIAWARVGEPYLDSIFEDIEIRLPLKFSSNDNCAMLYRVKQGTAICYLADYHADELIAKGELVEILADVPKRQFITHAVYLSHRHQSAVIKAFIDFLKQRCEFKQKY